jgi:predicted ATPase
MTTTIQYRTKSTGTTSLLNAEKALEIFAVEHADGWGVHFTIPRQVFDPKPKSVMPAIAWGLEKTTADLVITTIAAAIRDKVALVNVDDVVEMADQAAWYAENGVCVEEVSA